MCLFLSYKRDKCATFWSINGTLAGPGYKWDRPDYNSNNRDIYTGPDYKFYNRDLHSGPTYQRYVKSNKMRRYIGIQNFEQVPIVYYKCNFSV